MSKGAVLIVDDDATVQELLREIVEKHGFSASVVEQGDRALGEISRHRYDLLFLDLNLPGLGGIEILQKIKEKGKNVLTVIVTGFADDPIALKAMSMGPLLLIRKPFTERDIREVLNIVLKARTV